MEGIQKGFNEAINLAKANPSYNPLLDEIADLRILRVNLRTTIANLKKNEVAGAKTAFKKFFEGWDSVEDLISTRDKTIYRDIEDSLSKLDGGLLRAEKPDVPGVLSTANALLTRYNDGLKLLTDALSGAKK